MSKPENKKRESKPENKKRESKPEKQKLETRRRLKTWEWRMFWPGDRELPADLQKIRRKEAQQIDYEIGTDRYLLVEGCRHNLKVRQKRLQIKPLLGSRGGFQHFAPKQSLAFPFPAAALEPWFPLLGALDIEITSPVGLEVVLERVGYRTRWCEVHKERFVYRWGASIQLEVASLKTDTSAAWSACLVGHELKRVAARSRKVPSRGGTVSGYVDYLRQMGSGSP